MCSPRFLLLIGIGAACLQGCVSPPVAVWIDPEALGPNQPTLNQTAKTAVTSPSRSGAEAVIPRTNSNTVQDGISSDKVQEALQDRISQRGEVLKRIQESSEQLIQQRLDFQRQVQTQSRKGKLYAAWEEAAEKSRIPFEKYVEEVGRLNRSMTRLRGFPDVKSDQPPRDEFEAQQLGAIRSIRLQLNEIDLMYKTELDAIYSEVEGKVSQLAVEDQRELKQLESNLRRQQQILAATLSKLETPLSRERIQERLRTTLPASPEVRASISAKAAQATKIQTQNRVSQDVFPIEEELKIWLKLRGYTLARSKTLGQNKTSEFLEWRRKRQVGR